ncbi:high-potential iron-sulfur protein [Haloarculaceae archaeon H-GB2-1]|nr:high-potential iron-sulfur protein [Haloarculaceae archaeon H-GB1-1]MEA5406244.1 high-potential iron-sulfur protein [Haloarculaceae archaeon H-GB2-1]
MSNQTSRTRRRFLHLTGVSALTGLAGCGGGGGDGNGGETETAMGDGETETAMGDGETETAMGDGETTAASDEVPEEYVTATSLGGTQRDPDGLSSKESVNYQSEPNEGNQCSGCQFYIEDKNGDGMGACAIVEGLIAPDAWCASYVAYEG